LDKLYVKASEWEGTPALLDYGPRLFATVLRRAGRDKEVWKHVNLDSTVEAAKQAVLGEHEQLKAVILDNAYLFIYHTGLMWWGDGRPWLLEQFFMRLAKEGTPSRAMAGIDQLAKDEGCSLIIMGSTLSPDDEAMARLCKMHGYSQQGLQLMKET
jgi:hypothetical protein